MSIKHLFNTSLLLISALFIQSCGSDGDAEQNTLTVVVDETPVTTVNIPTTGGDRTLLVYTKGNWTANVNNGTDAATGDTWCEISPSQGSSNGIYHNKDSKGYATIKVSVKPNLNKERNADIVIKVGVLNTKITIHQDGTGKNDPCQSANEFIQGSNIGYTLNHVFNLNSDEEIPAIKSQFFKDFKDAGINVVRIPVNWGNHANGNTIQTAWMAQVKEFVDNCISNNIYVILNMQGDAQPQGWLYLASDQAQANSIKERYVSMWSQIATAFSNEDEHLLFESFGEIYDKDGNATAPESGSQLYATLNDLQNAFVATVRAAGGEYNPTRNLLITGYGAMANSNNAINNLALPADKVSNHLMFAFRNYDPASFCLDNAGENYDNNMKVFTPQMETSLKEIADSVSTKCSKWAVPFIFSEIGVLDGSENKNINDRIKYGKYWVSLMDKYKTFAIWSAGLYNLSNSTWTYHYTSKRGKTTDSDMSMLVKALDRNIK